MYIHRRLGRRARNGYWVDGVLSAFHSVSRVILNDISFVDLISNWHFDGDVRIVSFALNYELAFCWRAIQG